MIYLFNHEEKLIKIIRSDAIRSAVQSQELTKDGYVSDKLIVNIKAMNDIDLEQVEYIAIRSVNDKFKYDMYFLLSHSTEHRITELIGVQSGIEELRKSPIYDIRPTGDARLHATQLVKGTNWTIGYVPDTPSLFKNYYYRDVFESLKGMCQLFGIEMQFHVEINNNRIGNRYIEFKKRIGTATHRRVVYGHNALKIVKEVQRADLVTALVGRGKGEQVSSAGDETETETGEVTTQTADGYGRKITLEEVEWRKTDGKPVDKPLGDKFIEIPEATAKYGIKTPDGMRPKIGFIEFSEIEDRNLLIERTYEALTELCRPQVLFQTSSAYLTAEIGDTIRVVRHDIKIDYAVRVIKIEWDRLTNRATKIELGDRLVESAGSQMRSIADRAMNRLADEIDGNIQRKLDHLPSASGFNTNWYSETEPENPRINDIWYQPDPEHEGHYIMRIWNGEIWEEIVRTKNHNRVDELIKETEAKVQAMEDEFAKIQERNDAELEAFRKELESLNLELTEEEIRAMFDNFELSDEQLESIADRINLDTQNFDDLKAQLEAVRETSRVNAEMIGNDGVTRYNKNLLMGEFDRKILFTDDHITIEANDGGFKRGETYTVSFEAICELLAKANVSFNFDKETVRRLLITMTPDFEKLPIVESNGEKVQAHLGEYAVKLVSDWYQTQSSRLNVTGDSTVDINLEYREIADGNLEMTIQGEWAEAPEIILDGGGG